MKLLFMNIAVVFALSICAIAEAKEDIDAQANTAFKEGIQHFDEGRYEEAAASFREAYQLKPGWKLQYNIGQSEAAAKRHGLALLAFEEYLSQGGDDVSKKRQSEVMEETQRLREFVGAIEVEAPVGSVVFVDGIKRDTAPLPGPMMVATGKIHQVVVKLDDKVLLERPIRVSVGQVAKIEAGTVPISLKSAPEEEAPTGPGLGVKPNGEPNEEKKKKLRTWGWVTTGLGAAILVGGAVTGGIALSKDNDLQDRCLNDVCPREYWDENDSLHNLGVTTDVLIGVGSAAAVAGIVMLVISYVRSEKTENDVALIPTAGRHFAGASIQGRF